MELGSYNNTVVDVTPERWTPYGGSNITVCQVLRGTVYMAPRKHDIAPVSREFDLCTYDIARDMPSAAIQNKQINNVS